MMMNKIKILGILLLLVIATACNNPVVDVSEDGSSSNETSSSQTISSGDFSEPGNSESSGESTQQPSDSDAESGSKESNDSSSSVSKDVSPTNKPVPTKDVKPTLTHPANTVTPTPSSAPTLSSTPTPTSVPIPDFLFYSENPGGIIIGITSLNSDANIFTKGGSAIFTWESGYQKILFSASDNFADNGVVLVIENEKLIELVFPQSKIYNSENPTGRIIQNPSYLTGSYNIPANGYILYVPENAVDSNGRNMINEINKFISAKGNSLIGQSFTLSGHNLSVNTETRNFQTSKLLSPGLEYTRLQLGNFLGLSRNLRVDILRANIFGPHVGAITSKANDVVVSRELLISQSDREISGGRQIIAGINGDMFGSSGINLSMQIKSGRLLINHNSMHEVNVFPVLAIDKTGKAYIDTFSIEGNLSSDGKSIRIDSLNRNEHAQDKICLYTNYLNVNKRLIFNDPGNAFVSNGAMAVVTGINNADKIEAGKQFSGTITKVYSDISEIDIPNNAVIITGFGNKADWIRNNLKEGKSLTFNFNVYMGSKRTIKNDIVEAIGSYNWLVRDGKAVTKSYLTANYNSALVNNNRARTSVGITKNNQIVAVTVDEKISQSGGMSMHEKAIMMEKLGVIAAIGLDGGGTTEMIAKMSPTETLKTINNPSDGRARTMTNSILFYAK